MNSKIDGSCTGFRRRASAIAASTTAMSSALGAPRGDVGAIHRKARDHFDQRAAQTVQREVADTAIGFRQAIERAREHVQLARHRRAHHEPLAAYIVSAGDSRRPVNRR